MQREWTYLESAFSADECRSIIDLAMARTRSPGTVGPFRPTVDTRYRQSEVAFIQRPDPDFADVFERLDDHVERANEEFFGVRYNRRVPSLQFTMYQSDGGRRRDYYRAHSDTSLLSGGRLTQRKLSVVVQLSDPNDYTGGEFRMHHVEAHPPRAAIRTRGTLVIFPSLIRHEVTVVKTGTRLSLVGWYRGERWQ